MNLHLLVRWFLLSLKDQEVLEGLIWFFKWVKSNLYNFKEQLLLLSIHILSNKIQHPTIHEPHDHDLVKNYKFILLQDLTFLLMWIFCLFNNRWSSWQGVVLFMIFYQNQAKLFYCWSIKCWFICQYCISLTVYIYPKFWKLNGGRNQSNKNSSNIFIFVSKFNIIFYNCFKKSLNCW